MVNNVQKTHFQRSMNDFAQRKASEAIGQLGKSLPCSVVSVSGSIVTVKFEVDAAPFTLPNVVVPSAFPEYMRVPLQPGDKGVVISADALLSTIAGLGTGTPDLSVQASLSCLLFIPVSSKAWTASENPNAFVLYGPDGVIIRDKDSAAVLKVTPEENSWLAPGGAPATIKGDLVIEGNLRLGGRIFAQAGGSYGHNIETTGDVVAKFGVGSVTLSTHQHTQGNDTHGDGELPTNAPTPGT